MAPDAGCHQTPAARILDRKRAGDLSVRWPYEGWSQLLRLPTNGTAWGLLWQAGSSCVGPMPERVRLLSLMPVWPLACLIGE